MSNVVSLFDFMSYQFNPKSCLDFYIKYTWCAYIFLITLLNKLELIFLHSLMISSISIKYE